MVTTTLDLSQRINWLEWFSSTYFDQLNPKSSGAKRGLIEGHIQRGPGFQQIFQRLLNRRSTNFHIIETGTLRNPGNWKDGQSARLFTEFVDYHGGWVKSVDIDIEAVAIATKTIKSKNFTAFHGDSVQWLQQQDNLHMVDLFYLDSYDVKWEDDHNSAEHHLKEFQAIEPHLKAGALVAIDDNSRLLSNNQRTGKGRRIVEYLESIGRRPVYDAYQIIYQF